MRGLGREGEGRERLASGRADARATVPSPTPCLNGACRAGGARQTYTKRWLCRVLSCLILGKSQNLSGSVSSSVEWADHKNLPTRVEYPCQQAKDGSYPHLALPTHQPLSTRGCPSAKAGAVPVPAPGKEALPGGGKRQDAAPSPSGTGTGFMQVCSTPEPGYRRGWSLVKCYGAEGDACHRRPCLLPEHTPAGKEEACLNPGRRGAKHAGPGLPPGPGGPLNTPARQGPLPTGRDQP